MGIFPEKEDYCPDCCEPAIGRLENSMMHENTCPRYSPRWGDPGCMWLQVYKEGGAVAFGLMGMAFAIKERRPRPCKHGIVEIPFVSWCGWCAELRTSSASGDEGDSR